MTVKIVERLVQADGNGSHGNLQRKDLFSRTIKGGNCSFLIDIIEVVIKLKTPCFIDRTMHWKLEMFSFVHQSDIGKVESRETYRLLGTVIISQKEQF